MPAGRPSARALVIVRKFRLAVVWGLIGLLWWCLLTALERQLQYAEEQGTRLVLAQLRAALVVKGAETMLTQPERLAAKLHLMPGLYLENQITKLHRD